MTRGPDPTWTAPPPDYFDVPRSDAAPAVLERVLRTARGAPILAVLVVLGCGGQSGSDGTGGVAFSVGGGSQLPASTGGGGGTGGSLSSGGTGGTATTPCPMGVGLCAHDCFDQCYGDSPTCPDGVPVCPDDQVLRSSCPDQACCATVNYSYCCDSGNGALSRNPCSDDGYRPLCPEGSKAAGEYWCIPDSLDVEDCSTLDDQPCTIPDGRCRSFVQMETDCWCNAPATGDGVGVWSCAYYIGA